MSEAPPPLPRPSVPFELPEALRDALHVPDLRKVKRADLLAVHRARQAWAHRAYEPRWQPVVSFLLYPEADTLRACTALLDCGHTHGLQFIPKTVQPLPQPLEGSVFCYWCQVADWERRDAANAKVSAVIAAAPDCDAHPATCSHPDHMAWARTLHAAIRVARGVERIRADRFRMRVIDLGELVPSAKAPKAAPARTADTAAMARRLKAKLSPDELRALVAQLDDNGIPPA